MTQCGDRAVSCIFHYLSSLLQILHRELHNITDWKVELNYKGCYVNIFKDVIMFLKTFLAKWGITV